MHLPLHKSFLRYNESAVFLGFHTDLAREGPSNGGKLPLTIYERSYEATTSGGDAGANREGHVKGPSAAMDVDGLAIKFRELPYTVETGEAERIGVEFVARGGGNAGSVQREVKPQVQSDSKASDPKGKGKFKTKDTSIVKGTTADETAYLAPEEEERKSNGTTAVASHANVCSSDIYSQCSDECHQNAPLSCPSHADVSLESSGVLPHRPVVSRQSSHRWCELHCLRPYQGDQLPCHPLNPSSSQSSPFGHPSRQSGVRSRGARREE